MSGPDLLAVLLAEVRELRLEVRELRADLHGRGLRADPASADLLRAIDAACGLLPFMTGDLIEHAALPERADLAAAIGTSSAKKLGRRLVRIAGIEFDGLVLDEIRKERGVIMWQLRVSRV